MQTANVMTNRLSGNELSANKQAAQQAGTDMEAIHGFMENRGIFWRLNSIMKLVFVWPILILSIICLTFLERAMLSLAQLISMFC